MKAIIYETYGSPEVLTLREVAKPVPQEGEVLIKIQATAVNKADWYLLQGTPILLRLIAGPFAPKNQILGADIAGTVEAIGENVKQFQPGDAVFGDLSAVGNGGLAEYVAVPEKALALKPANVSFEEAASVPMAAVTALQGLRDKGQIQPGQKVLINGASGGVGSFAVQIAKSFGTEVTAVCSTRHVEQARAMGADHVIDYSQEDFTRNGQRYDLIFAVNGYHSLTDYKRALSAGGTYVAAGGTMAQIFQAMLLGPLWSIRGDKKMGSMGEAKSSQADLNFMATLLQDGKVQPVIDKCYPLSDAADAFRYLGAGHARGKIIIVMA